MYLYIHIYLRVPTCIFQHQMKMNREHEAQVMFRHDCTREEVQDS